MKNIHVLLTDKPSRLYLEFGDGDLCLANNALPQTKRSNNQHIYITNDEVIKEAAWRFDIELNRIEKGKETGTFKNWKKIILTTDPDLIKAGVQAITDEFLEWFVKNPSCEEVEVKKGFADGTTWGYNFLDYKIIIPQEQPKQETVGKEFYGSADKTITVKRQQTFIKTDNVDGQWLSPVPTERAWQEEKLVEIFRHYPNASPKWQYMNGLIQNSLDAKQMYSEQELRNAMDWMLTQYFEFHEWPAMGRVNHYIQTIKQQAQ
jgi:hypothetical protein